MIAVVIGGRRSIRALADYVLHDQATATDPRPVSSERVEWTACLGVPMTDPQLMVRCMQGLAADAAILKSLAGVPASGRKLSNPYEHGTPHGLGADGSGRHQVVARVLTGRNGPT